MVSFVKASIHMLYIHPINCQCNDQIILHVLLSSYSSILAGSSHFLIIEGNIIDQGKIIF